jgi:hypothetical protein
MFGQFSVVEYLLPSSFFIYKYSKFILINLRYQTRDKVKKEEAKKRGMTLILVPFWWDWEVDRFIYIFYYKFYLLVFLTLSFPRSLVATIKRERPELLQDVSHGVAEPLSEDPPQSVLKRFNYGTHFLLSLSPFHPPCANCK